ncbi:MAG: DUF1501 domain-containing protein [Pirellulaceae bacterium]
MLHIGRQRVMHGGGVTRRGLLQAGGLAACGLSLADFLRWQAAAAEPHGRAKSVILLWLWGGPSHLETFDMKPAAPVEYRGPYRPVATNVPGIEICELLPGLARRADRFSLLRAVNHPSNDHGIAGTIGLTGSINGAVSLGGKAMPGQVMPTHGAVISKVQGFDPAMPRFVAVGDSLHQGKRSIVGEDGAGLGALHDPFRCDYDPDQGIKIPALQLLDGVSPSGLASREGLRGALNDLARIRDTSPAVRLDRFFEQAYSLLTSEAARQVFDLSRESAAVREAYGQFRFGQCCLLARRLVEAGVRFVQVNWSSHVEPVEDTGDGGWDTHDRHFQQFQDRFAWMLDQALSALLDDLQTSGLLDETIVIAKGEFGRTPKINNKAGRDHWNQCYSALIAGGGFRAGQIIGESDKRAEYPMSRSVSPADLFTTILQQVGIGTTQLTRNGLAPLGSVIEELI